MPNSTRADAGRVMYPVLAPHLRFQSVGDQQTLLVSETFNTLLHGELIADLLPVLNGRRSLDKVVADLETRYTGDDVRTAVASLAQKGYVVSGKYDMDQNQAAYWSSLGATPRWVEQRLKDARITVKGEEGRLARHLRNLGATIDMGESDLTVMVCRDYLEERFEKVNRIQLKTGKPWLLVRPHGIQPLFGPIFHSDDSGPCWSCFSYRLRAHNEVHNFLRNFAGEDAAFKPFASEPVVFDALCGIIAAEIVKWIVLGEKAPIHEHAISINVGSLASSFHRVTRRPQCMACGSTSLHRPDRSPVPLRLEASPNSHRSSGGERSVAPEVTLAKYRHLVDPISGVVTWLSRTTDERDDWLHVHWAGNNLGLRGRSLSSLRRSLRSKSAGKGSTREQSEVSALCEAVERYSGMFHGEEIHSRRRYSEFGVEEAIHPNTVQLFSDSQLDSADSINAVGHPYNIVPSRFDPDVEIDWSPVWSFTQKRHRYLPTSMLYSIPAEMRGPSDLIADSNGCAAGNTLEEAILQGFYELVERDAFAIWWYNQLQVPMVDLASFDDSYLAMAGDYYRRFDRDLWLLDVTSDIDIPVFVALSRSPDGQTEDIIYGAGAHANPHVAALRAICELNQCLTWLPSPGKQDGRPMIDDPMALSWWKTARLADCSWLQPSTNAVKKASDFPLRTSTDIRDDVEHCQSIVESKGMEFLVLDQTRPDIGMPVVRVVVPGMRHFWARFAPGRLYDVPVAMGYRRFPLGESELNASPVIA